MILFHSVGGNVGFFFYIAHFIIQIYFNISFEYEYYNFFCFFFQILTIFKELKRKNSSLYKAHDLERKNNRMMHYHTIKGVQKRVLSGISI